MLFVHRRFAVNGAVKTICGAATNIFVVTLQAPCTGVKSLVCANSSVGNGC